jgi:hypothetical protein
MVKKIATEPADFLTLNDFSNTLEALMFVSTLKTYDFSTISPTSFGISAGY